MYVEQNFFLNRIPVGGVCSSCPLKLQQKLTLLESAISLVVLRILWHWPMEWSGLPPLLLLHAWRNCIAHNVKICITNGQNVIHSC